MQIKNLFSRISNIGKTFSEDNIDIYRFKKIDNFAYRGAKPTPEQLTDLKKLGVTTIFDFRLDNRYKDIPFTEKEVVEKLGMKYIHIPFSSSENPSQEDVDKFFTAIDNVRKNNEKVFLHCHYGKDRTGLFSAMYKLKYGQDTLDNCIEEMYQIGHDGVGNPTLVPFLKDFNEKLTENSNLNLSPSSIYNKAFISKNNTNLETNTFIKNFSKEKRPKNIVHIINNKHPELLELREKDYEKYSKTISKIININQIINYDYNGYIKYKSNKMPFRDFRHLRHDFYKVIRTPQMLEEYIKFVINHSQGIKCENYFSKIVADNAWLMDILE